MDTLRQHKRSSDERGFSLAEVTVALGITAILFLAALSMLAMDHRLYNRDDAVLEAAREGRYAIDKLERDMLMLGYQVDVRTVADPGPDGTENTDDDLVGQPAIAYAAPYELVFNADIDPTIDAIKDGLTADSVPSGYAPVTFHTGAETIRYTLDSNGDGDVDGSDQGDDSDEAVIKNDGLFLLRRETYGYNGTDNQNPAGPVALVRGPVDYPNGSRAIPLFLYWGHFDSDPAEDLWGDDGSGGGTAGNGILEAGELAALGPVTDEDTDDDAVLDSGEDRNGNGTLERRIADLITRVEIHVTCETSYPDMNYEDPNRSSTNTPFRHRSVTMNTEIKPRNTDLPGGACGDEPEKTSSPSIVNACSDSLADGKVTLSWSLSADDGNFENDIEKYLIWRTDVNSVFGPTAFDEVLDGTSSWDDDWIEMRTWPPRQYWYRVRAMDCTPQLSRLDPVAGPYPSATGPSYPTTFTVADVAGDAGTTLQVDWAASPDDPSNTTGYGQDVSKYYVYRSTQPDYRCVAPINKNAITADGSASYTYVDNDANSDSAPTYGELYYYWMRAMDDASVLSPYSPRACARSYKGPNLPAFPDIRVASYSASDHPVDAWCLPNPANDSAGYDPYLIEYKLYTSSDLNSDGTLDSMVDIAVGYTENANLEQTKYFDGIFWLLGDSSNNSLLHGITAGATPRDLGTPGSSLNDIDFINRVAGLAVGDSGEILQTSDGGINWHNVAGSVTASDLVALDMMDENTAVAVGAGGTIVRSDDGGSSWSLVSSPVSTDLRGVSGWNNVYVAAGDNGTVLISTDAGSTFTENLTYPGTDPIYDVCTTSSPVGSTLIYAATLDAIYVSADGGGTWSRKDFTGEGQIASIDCVETGAAIAASRNSGAVLLTTNEGTSWSYQPAGASEPVDVGMVTSRLVWVADRVGSLHYRDHTGNWQTLSLSASLVPANLAVRDEIVFEVSSTQDWPSGTPYYGVITTAYNQGSALDGEAGMIPDQPSSIESPDDSDPQIRVDSCNSFELSVIQP